MYWVSPIELIIGIKIGNVLPTKAMVMPAINPTIKGKSAMMISRGIFKVIKSLLMAERHGVSVLVPVALQAGLLQIGSKT